MRNNRLGPIQYPARRGHPLHDDPFRTHSPPRGCPGVHSRIFPASRRRTASERRAGGHAEPAWDVFGAGPPAGFSIPPVDVLDQRLCPFIQAAMHDLEGAGFDARPAPKKPHATARDAFAGSVDGGNKKSPRADIKLVVAKTFETVSWPVVVFSFFF